MRLVFFVFVFVFGAWGAIIVAQTEVVRVGDLPGVVPESSGLLLLGGQLITHNDSGNLPELYVLDSANLDVLRTVRLLDAVNTDWEDLAADQTHLYIADIGNNLGRRTDLRILKISIAEFQAANEVAYETISFSYPEQTDFNGNGNSDWDAEALLVQGDSLLLFTKEWQSNGTVAYQLPKTPGEYAAKRLAEYQVGGLITGACLESRGSGVVLLGYSGQLQPFLVRVPHQGTGFSFPAETSKELLQIGFAQTEGIISGAEGSYYISSEAFTNALVTLPASVYKAEEPESEMPEPGDGEDSPEGEEGMPGPGLGMDELRIYREPGSHLLEYAYGSTEELLGRAIYDAGGRRVLFEKGPEIRIPQIDISQLETAVYYLTLYLRGQTLSAPFLSY